MQCFGVMGQDAVERFIGRILTDDLFRRETYQSFERATASEGFVFTSEERQVLKRLDRDLLERLSLGMDLGIKRSVTFVDFGGGFSARGIEGDKGKR